MRLLSSSSGGHTEIKSIGPLANLASRGLPINGVQTRTPTDLIPQVIASLG